jgi:hypothetical protein
LASLSANDSKSLSEREELRADELERDRKAWNLPRRAGSGERDLPPADSTEEPADSEPEESAPSRLVSREAGTRT